MIDMAGLIQPTRRGFLIGLGSLVAAPAIVRASSLMALPVRVKPEFALQGWDPIPDGWEVFRIPFRVEYRWVAVHPPRDVAFLHDDTQVVFKYADRVDVWPDGTSVA